MPSTDDFDDIYDKCVLFAFLQIVIILNTMFFQVFIYVYCDLLGNTKVPNRAKNINMYLPPSLSRTDQKEHKYVSAPNLAQGLITISKPT